MKQYRLTGECHINSLEVCTKGSKEQGERIEAEECRDWTCVLECSLWSLSRREGRGEEKLKTLETSSEATAGQASERREMVWGGGSLLRQYCNHWR